MTFYYVIKKIITKKRLTSRMNDKEAGILRPKKHSIKKDYKKTSNRLGSGLSGHVYLWKNKITKKHYAVKVFFDDGK